jgi:hypothetical protein
MDWGLPVCSGDGEATTNDGVEKFVGVRWAPVTPSGSSYNLRRGRGR